MQICCDYGRDGIAIWRYVARTLHKIDKTKFGSNVILLCDF